jgi:hypothetical protein
MLTPGGHRRFSQEDLGGFLEQRHYLAGEAELEKLWAETALSQARKEIVCHKEQSWLAVYDDRDKERKRLLGRRLIGLMLQYVSADDKREDILEEASEIGQEHADHAIRLGLPLREALMAAMFFRDAAIEAAIHLPKTAKVEAGANLRLFRRLSQLLNRVQLAIAESYDRTQIP